MIKEIFIILVLFQVKHLLADYLLQAKYMLGKMNKDGWVLPLAAHAAVHSYITLCIVIFFDINLWWLAIVDFVVHFIVDRVKASPNILGRFNPNQKAFWFVLGLDQFIHHLTHYFIIWMVVS